MLVPVYVVSMRFLDAVVPDRIGNGCMILHGLWVGGGSRSTKPCVFPCKVAAAGDESYLVCAAVAAGVVWFLLCVLQQCLFLCA